VLVVICVYLLANWAYLALLGAPGVASSTALAADAVGVVWPKIGAKVVAGAVALSAFGVLNAQLLSGPRLVQGMAADGRFFRIFAAVHSRFATPVWAILLISVTGLVLLFSAGKDGLDALLTGVIFIDGTFFALTGVALLVLRARGGGEPGFRTPLYPVVPLVFVIGALGAVAGSLLKPEVRSAALIGLAWMVLGTVLYFAAFRRRHAPGGAP
jgi:APA family basic amino acid/polyamine antiporter